MLRELFFGICALCLTTSAAHSQSQSGGSPYIKYAGASVFLSQISSVGIETKLTDGRTLTHPRHQIGGIATFATRCGPGTGGGSGTLCPSARPPSSATLFFHEHTFNADPAARNLFALCRRTMESASPKDTVQLDGDIEVAAQASFIIFKSLTSCRVTRNNAP
jgi:hypothetical protein